MTTNATEPRIIKFYETTLRDGEQTPGVNYFPEEKLAIAQALADMGFDTLDCGFPISSPGEFEAVRLIASKVDNAEICAIARDRKSTRLNSSHGYISYAVFCLK